MFNAHTKEDILRNVVVVLSPYNGSQWGSKLVTNLLQNIFICILQKIQSHPSLKWHNFWVNCPFKTPSPTGRSGVSPATVVNFKSLMFVHPSQAITHFNSIQRWKKALFSVSSGCLNYELFTFLSRATPSRSALIWCRPKPTRKINSGLWEWIFVLSKDVTDVRRFARNIPLLKAFPIKLMRSSVEWAFAQTETPSVTWGAETKQWRTYRCLMRK